LRNTLLYNYSQRKIIQPLLKVLREGITPQRLALTLAMGVGFGLIPVFGLTTVFCLGAAFAFRLNKPAMLLINFAIYPLQLILYIPFIKLGEFICGFPPTSMNIYVLIEMFRDDWAATLSSIWLSNLLGIFAWLLLMVPLGFAIYYMVLPILKNYLENWHRNRRHHIQNIEK
jgi:uncharacterized protein (DUF2062 family)